MYRVAAGYAVVAWLVIQITATVFPIWDLPRWSLRLVLLLGLAGFPIAFVLAWAFEVRPERTPGPDLSSARSGRNSRLNPWLLGAIGAVVSLSAGFFLLPRATARKLDKSIAVLPFENFSENKENEHFADGIHDDLLATLAKIGDLKVISRTSVMPYRGNPGNVRQIARTLDVGAILEGSVRREGNRVRITVQLIDGRTDEHIWAEEYDRQLTDVFAIQTDLAREIAAVLHSKLTAREKARLEKKPTENGEAYLLYLQAHDHFTRPDERVEDMKRAEELFQKAIELDPSFALAFARLSRVASWSRSGIRCAATWISSN